LYMTVFDLGNGLWIGLSSDTKPSIATGSRFYETDTGDNFITDGTFWWLAGYPSPLSNRKTGSYPSGTSALVGTGLLSQVIASTGAGSQLIGFDATNGKSFNALSGAVSGNKGGLRVNSSYFIRQFNPRIRMRFKMGTTANENAYFGFVGGSPAELATADPFGAGVPGVVFGINTGNATNFVVMHNDTAGATVIDDTGTAFDTTTVHTVNLVADNANTRFAWNLDGGTYHFITTDIPSAINSLAPIMSVETEEAVAKSFFIYNWIVQSDI
jgi:hypothetical protein